MSFTVDTVEVATVAHQWEIISSNVQQMPIYRQLNPEAQIPGSEDIDRCDLQIKITGRFRQVVVSDDERGNEWMCTCEAIATQ